ncbi:MAG TPA: MJ0042-type zinc finger domain-containing protein [Azospirillaceae bacterium]|nr:MJ0042-type zinc finger domain-containing protein [Azospirillaceae bacterium]
MRSDRMIISCSVCSTRFLVDAKAIGPEGRRVRCGSCGNTWVQTVPPEATPAPEIILEPPPDRIRPIPPGSNLPVVIPPKRRKGPVIGWTAAGLVAGALAVGLVFARHEIVETWPPAAAAYEVVGLEVEAIGTGLSLQNVRSEQRMDNGTPVLALTGQVANVSDKARDVPPIRAVALDPDRRALQSWRIQTSPARLLPGEVATFASVQRDVGEQVAQIRVTFEAP